ncbi:MAG TPA: hypothetical protein VG826_27480 [Pirellulales bacterium]|nr:hypothetical protein [Pirellulales bacterium]
MPAIRAGERWQITLEGMPRSVVVIAETDTAGWWQCVDVQTGIQFLAREQWFVDRELVDSNDV